MAALVAAEVACSDRNRTAGETPIDDGARAPCVNRNRLRNVYFGDLHVHTAYSFDVYVFDIHTGPDDAYRFAKGEPIALPPLDSSGRGTQVLRLDRPLDFTAVTDHSEFIGEVESCVKPGSAGYDTESCRSFRAGGTGGQAIFGGVTVLASPERDQLVCGDDGRACLMQANEVWRRTIAAANAAYDRTSRCSFTSLVGYEYTANTGGSSQHRNVIFRSDRVPFPTSYVEQPTPQGLWVELDASCRGAGAGCDVIAIPHNPNQSNGNLFRLAAPGTTTPDDERSQAAFRAEMEPVIEIYQHKGDSECMNGVSGILGAPDELCEFEKLRQAPFEDCGDGTGSGGIGFSGCVSRRDFLRGILLDGLREEQRLGVNPFRLGVIGSTDTHNGTPGAVQEGRFLGHRGVLDDSPDERLSTTGFRSGVIFNPGGLAAVWAEENTRASIFAALKRREVFGTSGPRITVRFFGGWRLDDELCRDPAMIEQAYAGGVPMGGLLPSAGAASQAPSFLVSALRDPGGSDRAPVQLERIQIIKGWIEQGEAHQRVFDVVGDTLGRATVDPETCVPSGPGFDSMCAVWTDPDFDPSQHAFYYARVVENPSCRWTALTCNALSSSERPATCDDPAVVKTIQERAWTSPIWY